jgi:3-oxoacyl-[acyl-carrier protein] reductase
MNLGIAGKTAIVSAASRGIGKAVAIGLAKEGVNMAICARNEAELLTTAHAIESAYSVKVLPIVADLVKASDVKFLVRETVDRFGCADILVANAGGPPASVSVSAPGLARCHGIKPAGTVRLCREVIPVRKGWGRIVNWFRDQQPLEG